MDRWISYLVTPFWIHINLCVPISLLAYIRLGRGTYIVFLLNYIQLFSPKLHSPMTLYTNPSNILSTKTTYNRPLKGITKSNF
jgi:hypothetical protein